MAAWIHTPQWSSISFQVLGGLCSRYDESWANDGHTEVDSNYDRLYYLDSGHGRVFAPDGDTDLQPGIVYLFPGNGIRRRYRCLSEMELNWLHIRVEVIPGISLFSHYRPSYAATSGWDAGPLFKGILETLIAGSPEAALRRVEYLSGLLRLFLPASWEEMMPPSERVEQLRPALELIRSSVSRSLSLAELARSVSLHPTYFSNLFTEVFGSTPMRYHTELRMRRAQALLLDPTRSVGEVAEACGFQDQLYFSRIFKQRVGIPPKRYQEQRGVLEP